MTTHRSVSPAGAAPPVGPYVPATIFDRLVFVSGQGARHPVTNQLAGDDIEAQTVQVLENVRVILEAAGSSMQHVLRCTVYLTDMAEFKRMNAVYERVFGGHKPARTTVQVAALPVHGLRVEIDCIAYTP